ncbi:MAG: lactate utilization protein B [Geminicoccaceae bacterium]
MEIQSHRFKETARAALRDPELKIALNRTTGLLKSRRAEAYRNFPPFEHCRDLAARIKAHTIRHLDHYLEQFEERAIASGAVVHWASTAEEASRITVDICKRADAKSVTRVKSMLGEEIGLPDALRDAGIERIETDLAEHIIQLANERPSHIVIPAMHKTREQVSRLFADHHAHHRHIEDVTELVESARQELRQKYVDADVGISGANFLIAETGSVCTVTNEGNAELTVQLPRVQIVTAGIDKIVPTMEHATVLLRLLARSALGTDFTQYTTFINGPKRDREIDGPEQLHIVLVDNHRTDMIGSELQPMLRCIRCAACINHCPVYGVIGGHAYGAVYQGPMGSVLTPAMHSLERTKNLPSACTLNGRCQEVCPVKIPLPELMRGFRVKSWRQQLVDKPTRYGMGLWALFARYPTLYRLGTSLALTGLRLLRGQRTRLRSVPLAEGWTRSRDLPPLPARSFFSQYAGSKKTSA